LDNAKDFFIQVREATGDIPDIWVNLAHVYLLQKQYDYAIKMYQNCLKKFYNNTDSNILLYLARAFFEAGRIDECKNTLLQAIHIKPQNLLLWFNLALAQENFAVRVLQKDEKKT